MIACHCIPSTDRAILAGCKRAGTECGGCLPLVRELRAGIEDCGLCLGKCWGGPLGTYLDIPICQNHPALLGERYEHEVRMVPWLLLVRRIMDERVGRCGVRRATRLAHEQVEAYCHAVQ